MKKHRIRRSRGRPRPRPGWLELLTGGILLFLLLTGSLWSFSSAVGQPLQMSVFLGGCVLLTVLLTVLCALPTRWMLAGMAGVLLLDGLAVWRLFTAMRLGEIAYRCGFGTLSGFFPVFRSEFGCSPLEYRRGHLRSELQSDAVER